MPCSPPDTTSMLHWYARLPEKFRSAWTPKTIIVEIPHAFQYWACGADVEQADIDESKAVMDQVADAARQIGYPIFLRTDMLAGKHSWLESCYVANPTELLSHVHHLMEEHEMAFGCPDARALVVRQLLPTKPLFRAFHGRMPIVKELRLFVDNGKLICAHPYWPHEAIEEHDPDKEDWRELLTQANTEAMGAIRHAQQIALVASVLLPEHPWSADLLEDEEGRWWLTDMAHARLSYHWPECEVNPWRKD